MASLRRMASLDSLCIPSSNPASPSNSHLIRHSSLPNIFLCQPELTIGALKRYPPLKKAVNFMNKCGRVPATSKLALVCRALSSSQFIDEFPDFERLPQGRFSGPPGNVRRPGAPFASNKKEAIVTKGLDLEKSIVYSELRESACSWEVPPRFFMPYHNDTMGEKVLVEGGVRRHTHETDSDLCMQNSGGQNDLKGRPISLNDVMGRPMSLRMLKRKLLKVSPQTGSDKQWNSKAPFGEPNRSEFASHCGASTRPRLNYPTAVGDSVFSAFASLVYMLKVLQQHALSTACMQTQASGVDAVDVKTAFFHQNWVGRSAYAEMLDSLLWLFQQVFSCTPKLMLLTMMLLADFTLHSVLKHVAIPVVHLGEPPTMTTLVYNMASFTIVGGVDAMPQYNRAAEEQQLVTRKEHGFKEGFLDGILQSDPGVKNGDGSAITHGRSYSNGNWDYSFLRKLSPEHAVDGAGDDGGAGISTSSPSSSPLIKSSLLPLHHVTDIKGVDLDPTIKNMLVAPVRAPTLEADNYPCFDRTDLNYQQEINSDPSNPLLLANYAQFLHVVRHDNGRAEQLYRRAVMLDAGGDGEAMGRFASFLWVVKGDVEEAESAYKAAVTVDPTNAYHAGCYAHFMWNSSAGQAEENSCCWIADNLGSNSEQMPSS
ncbi:hypothetical protein GOP47_0022701 [Adiantum capillus-veneris]|uniref:Uncharacterized protein n=1 Tax=Adiantum capillus-veneris TaxID=13818 RepID=A0A9D4U6A4_ADICA|nr:hypothetical protein GOP47_0022701 [Adiantum capillus-veneris]